MTTKKPTNLVLVVHELLVDERDLGRIHPFEGLVLLPAIAVLLVVVVIVLGRHGLGDRRLGLGRLLGRGGGGRRGRLALLERRLFLALRRRLLIPAKTGRGGGGGGKGERRMLLVDGRQKPTMGP